MLHGGDYVVVFFSLSHNLSYFLVKYVAAKKFGVVINLILERVSAKKLHAMRTQADRPLVKTTWSAMAISHLLFFMYMV